MMLLLCFAVGLHFNLCCCLYQSLIILATFRYGITLVALLAYESCMSLTSTADVIVCVIPVGYRAGVAALHIHVGSCLYCLLIVLVDIFFNNVTTRAQSVRLSKWINDVQRAVHW
jgi:hypothetical protein